MDKKVIVLGGLAVAGLGIYLLTRSSERKSTPVAPPDGEPKPKASPYAAPVEASAGSAMGASADQIRCVQQQLNAAGFDAGSIDGQWGPATSDALRRAQIGRGLPATGSLDAPTRQALPLCFGGSAQAASERLPTGNLLEGLSGFGSDGHPPEGALNLGSKGTAEGSAEDGSFFTLG